MKGKWLTVSSVVLIVFALVLGGCSTAAPSSQGSSGNNGGSGEQASSENTVTITAWVQAKPPEENRLHNIEAAAEKLNEKFKEQGKDLKIVIDGKIDDSSWGDYKQKFVLAAESDNAPDIILSGHEDIAPWSQAGYIIPLDKYINKYPQFDDVYDTLWKATSYKGKKWAIPQDTEARVIYYRKDYLKKLGWSQDKINNLPKRIESGEFTLTDMLETAKAAQEKGIVEKGYGFWQRPKNGSDFYMWYYDYGGKMQDPSTGKLILDKKALLKEYQFFNKSTSKYNVTKDNIMGTEWDIWHKAVVSGKAFFIEAGTWTSAQWRQDYGMSDEVWNKMGYALLPAAKKGGTPATLSHPLVYMITSQSKHKELAAHVLALTTTPKLNARHAVSSNHLAILKTEEDVPKYKNAEFLSNVTYMLQYTHYLPNSVDFGAYDQSVFRGLSAVESGQLSPKEAVKTVVSDIKRKLGDGVIIK